MNSQTIRQSNLLDIIFENRNKEYGAYTLRKFYNNRLGLAVLTTLIFVALFSSYQFFHVPKVDTQAPPRIFDVPDRGMSNYQKVSAAKVVMKRSDNKKQQAANPAEMPPQIVNEQNINKPDASDLLPFASEIKIGGNAGGDLSGEANFGDQLVTGAEGGDSPAAPDKPKSSKPIILTAPDVMPQYPGGLKALLDYLKKNLRAPDDIEAGKMISVKVKFVVNYNGRLEAFNLLESGGYIFDNEVLRVLRKMPRWIPGKSNGENVSVYYTVPVKFTSDF
ncbi:MAG TPA: TonB family protein [Hanamia sp.]|nr:TonB family protein [Hanamia sp.]